MKLWSYPRVRNLGHPEIKELLDGPVAVQEKVDGSQFSFGKFDGELLLRSKGADLYPETSDKLFAPAIATAQRLFADNALPEGWVFRCETLFRAKHNTLAYDHPPKGNLVLFDIETAPSDFLPTDQVRAWAAECGIDVVPTFEVDKLDKATFDELLDHESFLGGQKIEGVVIKNYQVFGRDGKALMGKHVSERFKEVHNKEWKKGNPAQGDIVQRLIEKYRTEARWDKAVIHLRERGELEDSPRDIGKLIKEAQADWAEECADEVKDELWKWAKPKVQRAVSAGLAEYYKALLADKQFEEDA